MPGFGAPDLLTSAERADTTGLRTNAAAAQLRGHLCAETRKAVDFPGVGRIGCPRRTC